MEQQTYEREIDLIQLVRLIMKKWKIVLVAGLVGALLMGAMKIMPELQGLSNEKVFQEQVEKYQEQLTTYEMNKEVLQREISSLNTGIASQMEYNTNSLFMQIDPYDVQVGAIQYYIDSHYQVALEVDYLYQEPDRATSVLKAYASLAEDGTLCYYLLENMTEDLELRYLQELVQVEADDTNNILTIRVLNEDSTKCEELIALVKQCFSEYKDSVEKNIGEHELQIVAETTYAAVDLEMEIVQKENTDKLAVLVENLAQKQTALKNLGDPPIEPTKTVATVVSAVKNGIAYIIIGIVLGVFLAGAAIIVIFLFDSTIKEEKDVEFYLGVPVLAEIPVIKGTEKVVKKSKRNKKARLNQYGGR